MTHSYETDGAAIYAQSFAIIRAEADLARFDADEEQVAVRMIHAAGLVGLERHIRFSPGFVAAARAALQNGAPVLCDARMVSEGITRARLPAANRVICTLHDDGVPELARQMGNTRSAAALERLGLQPLQPPYTPKSLQPQWCLLRASRRAAVKQQTWIVPTWFMSMTTATIFSGWGLCIV